MRLVPKHRYRTPRRRRSFLASLERLEQRVALAVTASLSEGLLRIGFTPSTLPEQVARLSHDGSNYIVRNTNNIAIGSFPVAAVTGISVNGTAGRERLDLPATGLQPIATSLTVARTVVVAPGAVQIASTAVQLFADLNAAASVVFGGDVLVHSAVTVSAPHVRFESIVTGAAGSSLAVDSADEATILGGLAGDLRLGIDAPRGNRGRDR